MGRAAADANRMVEEMGQPLRAAALKVVPGTRDYPASRKHLRNKRILPDHPVGRLVLLGPIPGAAIDPRNGAAKAGWRNVC